MLFLLLNLLFLTQPDTLDTIYDNFYQNQKLYKEQIDLVTDKDFYYPGEKIFFFARVSSLQKPDPIKSKWVMVYLFDENKKVINYVRTYIKSEKSEGSIQIPTSTKTNNVYISIITAYSQNTTVKNLHILISGNIDSCIEPEDKISIKTKNIYLIPNKENEISISTTSIVEQGAVIIDENNKKIVDFRLRGNKVIRFTPFEKKNIFSL
jgi:hypothetical protein